MSGTASGLPHFLAPATPQGPAGGTIQGGPPYSTGTFIPTITHAPGNGDINGNVHVSVGVNPFSRQPCVGEPVQFRIHTRQRPDDAGWRAATIIAVIAGDVVSIAYDQLPRDDFEHRAGRRRIMECVHRGEGENEWRYLPPTGGVWS